MVYTAFPSFWGKWAGRHQVWMSGGATTLFLSGPVSVASPALWSFQSPVNKKMCCLINNADMMWKFTLTYNNCMIYVSIIYARYLLHTVAVYYRAISGWRSRHQANPRIGQGLIWLLPGLGLTVYHLPAKVWNILTILLVRFRYLFPTQFYIIIPSLSIICASIEKRLGMSA